MPLSDPLAGGALVVSAAPAPSTPLGPLEDGVVTWTTWLTLMGFVGLTALALLVAGPVARRLGPAALTAATTRLTRAAALLGLLAVPAVLTDLAHGASDSGGYAYGTAWRGLFDGTAPGLLTGLEVTLALAGALLVAPAALRPAAAARARTGLLAAGLTAGAVALGSTKFPDRSPDDWPRTVFETAMWMCHLFGGALWLGGLAGLALLAVPGAVAPADRRAFWPPVVRRFSVAATSCVAAIGLSGLFLYWEHVDGPSQLLSTMYGRVLGVKILLFGALLLLGAFNQFWLHPRLAAARATGDERPLPALLLSRFPLVVAVETLLGAAVLLVAPFLHGSARNQAFQAAAAHRSTVPLSPDALPRLPAKHVSLSTWVWGTSETLAVLVVVIGCYLLSGRIAQRRTAVAAAAARTAPGTGEAAEAAARR